jgi:hypothetical protein
VAPLQVANLYHPFNQLIVKEHNRTNKVVTPSPKKEQQRTNVAIASLEKEQQITY